MNNTNLKTNNLTIIVPIYKPTISLENILKNIKKQSDQNFDLIITIDLPSSNDLEIIEKLGKNFNNEIKIIINSTHQNINTVIKQSLSFVNTKYTYIFYSYSYIKSSFVKTFNNFINAAQIKPDFIEVAGYCRGLVSHDFYRSKFQDKKIINLNDNKKPIAMVSPFIFNSIITTDIFKKLFQEFNIQTTNLQYSSACKYLAISLAKTFTYLLDLPIYDYNESISLLRPKTIIDEWKEIHKYLENKTIEEELNFAKAMHYQYFIAGFLGGTKLSKKTKSGQNIISFENKLLSEIKKTNLLNLINTNKYFKEFEVKLIDEKDFLDNKNWNEILKIFIW